MKLDDLVKKEFPAQKESRKQWIIDTIRDNPKAVSFLWMMTCKDVKGARSILDRLKRTDRDALLLRGGVLTDQQIQELGE